MTETHAPGVLLLAAAVSLAACTRPSEAGGAQSTPPSAIILAEPAGAPRVPWSAKTREQRMEFMGLVVYPRMKALFSAHDPAAYAQFRCQTCHGTDMEAVSFRMPNALYALPAIDPVKAARAYDERTAHFMEDRVAPALAELLGKDDPVTAGRMGCHTCHQKE